MAISDVDGPLDGKRTNPIPEVGETFSVDPTLHPDEPSEVAKRVADLELTVVALLDRVRAIEEAKPKKAAS